MTALKCIIRIWVVLWKAVPTKKIPKTEG